MRILAAVPNKREFAARILGNLGTLRVLEHTVAARKPGLTVLTYHRIAEPKTNPFYDPVISATPENFHSQITWLSNHTRILTLEELINRVNEGSLGREPTVLVTFDDGYRDNFTVAAPILAAERVPATFFLTPAFLENSHVPWWDEVAFVIKQTAVHRFAIERRKDGKVPSLEIDVQTMSRTTAIMTIIRALLDETVDDERRFLDQLAACAEVTVDRQSLGHSLFMNWEEVRQLSELGTKFTIGSHSLSHPNLAQLDDSAQRRELTESKQILETRIGREIKAFAYPYGWPGTYTKNTKVIVAEAGYRIAFSSREAANRTESFDPLEISRLGVGSADSLALLRARIALHAAFGRSFL